MIIWFLILSLLAPDADARRRKRRRGPREPMQAYTQGYKEHKEVKEETTVPATKELIEKLGALYQNGKGCLCEAVSKNSFNCYCVSSTDKLTKQISKHFLKSLKSLSEIAISLDEYYNGNNFVLADKKDITGAIEIQSGGSSCVFSFYHCVCLNKKKEKLSGISHIDVNSQAIELSPTEIAYKTASAACASLDKTAYTLAFSQTLYSYFPALYAGGLVDEMEKLGKLEKKEKANLIQLLKKAEKDFASEDTKDDLQEIVSEISSL